MLFIRNKFLKYISGRLLATENVYKQLKWNMLSENTYAINYFEDKVKKCEENVKFLMIFLIFLLINFCGNIDYFLLLLNDLNKIIKQF